MTGPTGNVGSQLVRVLAERGVEHRVAAHRPTGDAVHVDYDDPSSWGPALDGVTRLFLLFPLPTPRAVDRRMLPFLRAAVAAGCEHVVYLSVFGGDTQRLIPHHRVERAVEAAPVTHTILRCSYFMQNLFRAVSTHGVDIADRGEVFIPAGRGRITFLDARDAAEVAFDALTRPDRHRDVGHALTGPERLDLAEVARLLTETLGRPVRYTDPSFPRFWRRLRARGVAWDMVAFMTGVYLLTRLGRNEPVTGELPRLLGRPARTFGEFARDERWRWETGTWS
ncbi:MAG: NmrA family NAD(P)-binding protein [Phycicoccus sp.]